MTTLTIDDYKNILEFYKKPIPKSERLIKISAEKILSGKLCRCIKKLEKKYKTRSVGICTKTVINRKGYSRGKFTCKKKNKIQLYKTKKNRQS